MIEHLSYSSIQTYLQCGRNWRFKYVDQLPVVVESDALVFGKSWHRFLQQQTPLQDENFAPAAVWDQVAESVPRDLWDMGRQWIATPAISNYLKTLPKQGVWEQRFELPVPGVPVPFIGFIDLIQPGGVAVDFKTSKRKWNQQQADESLQATFYAAALYAMELVTEFPIRFEYHIFTKTKTPDIQILETTRDLPQIMGAYNLVLECWNAMQAGVFIPNPVGWHCSATYCDYWNNCMGGIKDDRQSPPN